MINRRLHTPASCTAARRTSPPPQAKTETKTEKATSSKASSEQVCRHVLAASCSVIENMTAETDDAWIIEDPFGTRDQGQKWFQTEMTSGTSPLDLSNTDSPEELSDALAKSVERYEYTDHPVLVAVNMPNNYCIPDDLDCKGMKFVFFANLGLKKDTNAWFLTYMTSPTHGSVDGIVTDKLFENKPNDFFDYMNAQRNSGSSEKGSHLPDFGYYPYRKYDDEDVDEKNGGNPYCRIIVEVEIFHREGIHIRARGNTYTKPDYVRLFLAVKVYADEDDQSTFSAAIVLWEKGGDDNEIIMKSAVSFGTRELKQTEKDEFSLDAPNLLPLVGDNDWENLVDEDVNKHACGTFIIQEATAQQILYKVLDPDSNATPPEPCSATIPDLNLNLRFLRKGIYRTLQTRYDRRETKKAKVNS